ncbi:alpha/beta fold hydrolase [Lapidilactobacillus achengensis]|uniref:Alpha/beta fold hydrolase n=1 Tax=Lapidilactobacillus achengensis TaxID=2486000 RepID=A0ABW1UNK4_9LACO|nr:alpha/beta hydrolase [Lapidilactobacillus achengensis]
MEIRVNHTTLYYVQSGQGQPLILLHGNGESHQIFDKLLPTLSAYFQVFALDNRGHGKSAPVKEIHYQEMANDVVDFIKQLKLEKPLLYGFSDGGIIGLLVASQHPDLLGKLMVSGANLNPNGLHSKDRFLAWNVHLWSRRPEVRLLNTEPNITKADLQRIQIPTLVMAGEKDAVKISHTRYIADQIPDSSLMILPKETHSSYVIDSFKLLPIIRKFASQPARSTTAPSRKA